MNFDSYRSTSKIKPKPGEWRFTEDGMVSNGIMAISVAAFNGSLPKSIYDDEVTPSLITMFDPSLYESYVEILHIEQIIHKNKPLDILVVSVGSDRTALNRNLVDTILSHFPAARPRGLDRFHPIWFLMGDEPFGLVMPMVL